MSRCPYCGFAGNGPNAIECRKCQGSFVSHSGTLSSSRSLLIGPEKAQEFRRDALAAIAIGLLIKVYWGGYGPWPVIDNPTLTSLRALLEPLLIKGGAVAYLMGFLLRWM